MAEKRTSTAKVILRGGLDTNSHFLELADTMPGAATALLNYEPSLYGGYRRINGYEALEEDHAEVDPINAEGKILGVAIYDDLVIAARKQQSGATYKFYEWDPGGAWDDYTTGLTLTSTGVEKIRYDTFNFNGTNKVVFVDGVNGVIVFDGTNWTQPTGDQSIADPTRVVLFKNHVFVSGDATNPQLVVHSAPLDESEWDSAGGAGQINVGFDVKTIYPFREELYVFGEKQIKKIVTESTTFVVKDVMKNIGTVSGDSVQEINGDLIFLAPDGFRTIAATERIGDVEAASISKQIQQDIKDQIASSVLSEVESVVIRSKSQYRLFFNNNAVSALNTPGFLAGLKNYQNGLMFEWTTLRGIRTSSVTSGYINNTEYVVHGDFNGKVYRQEVGSSFDGNSILSVYTSPHLDFGDTQISKNIRTVNIFMRPEGDVNLNLKLTFDWLLDTVHNPASYDLENTTAGDLYGTGVYGIAVYGTQPKAVISQNVEGSGFAVQTTIVNYSTEASFSIQALVYEFDPRDRK